MPKHADYLAGWIDTSVHDFVAEIEASSSSMAYALVTCLDSCLDVRSVVKNSSAFQGLKGKYRFVGSGVLLTTRRLLAVERRHRLFYGFDEVWFFPGADVTPKPAALTITGPDRIASTMVDRLSGWMDKNSCSLGLGDGTGLNFCARVRGAARYLVHALSEAAEEKNGAAGRASA